MKAPPSERRRVNWSPRLRFFTCVLLTLVLFLISAAEVRAQWFTFGRAQRGYDRCVDLHNKREFDEARACIEEFLSEYPNSRWIEHLQFIEAKLETNLHKAQKRMHGFVMEYPDGPYSAEANFSLGELLELGGDYGEAQRFYSRVYVYFPASDLRDEASVKAGKCMLLDGDADSARLHLETYLAALPPQPWHSRAKEVYADALFETGELTRALQKYREIISDATSPEDASPECYLKIAGIYESMGNYKAALQAYRRFLGIFPDAIQKPAVEQKMAELASHLGVDLSADGRPHIIEAGLFETEQQAMRLVARLKKLGYRAYLVTRNMDHTELLSVRLGPYDSKDSAVTVADRLSEEAGIEATLLPQGGMFWAGDAE